MWRRFIRSFTGSKSVGGFRGVGWRSRANAGVVIIVRLPKARRCSPHSVTVGRSLLRPSTASPELSMPDWREEVRKRLSRLNLEPAHEAEIVEELAQHLDDVYQRTLKSGATEAAAKSVALNELATDVLLQIEMRRSHATFKEAPVAGGPTKSSLMADLLHDLSYAARLQRKNPAFTIVAVIALALGIGANTAIFSVVNTVILRPLPYPDPDSLVAVFETDTQRGLQRGSHSYPNFMDVRAQNTVFEQMSSYHSGDFIMTGRGEPARLQGQVVTADLFSLLGVQPMLGRTFLPDEDKPGETGRVVVLSHALFQNRFGGDPSFDNQAITLDGK